MQREWFDLVADAVWGQLAELAAEATREEGSAARELGRAVAAWRALLRLHEPAAGGGCARGRCARRGVLRHRSKDFCTVWQVAIAYFVRE